MSKFTTNWRSALLDGLAVFVGILVAFGLQATWDVSRDREGAAELLDGVTAELTLNRDVLQHRVDSLAAIQDSINMIWPPIINSSPGEFEFEDLVVGVWLAQPATSQPFMRAAFDEFMSGGNATLLESDELRNALFLYDQRLAMVESFEDRWKRFYDTQMLGYALQYWDLPTVLAGTPLGLTGLRGQATMTAFVGNQHFTNLLQMHVAWMVQTRLKTEEVINEIGKVLAIAQAVR